MKHLLIVLALLSGSASAMTYDEYRSIPEDKICDNLPSYDDVQSWVEMIKVPEEARKDFTIGFLKAITNVCVARDQLNQHQQERNDK